MLTALGLFYVALLLGVLAYIKWRLGFYVTSRTALLGWLWVVCGPPHVVYWLTGRLKDPTFIRMTVSFSLMWICFLATIEILRLVYPRQFKRCDTVAKLWPRMSVAPGYVRTSHLMLIASVGLVFMLWVSITENKIGNLITFLKLEGQTQDVLIFRGTMGGSKLYLYNLFLSAFAPFIGLLLYLKPAPHLFVYSWVRRLFILATMLGKITLFSRSPLGLFIVQLLVVKSLLRDNRITAGRVIGGVLLVFAAVLPLFYHYRNDIQAIVTYFGDRISTSLYWGMIPYFEYFPDIAPHAMGKNIRVINLFWYGGAEYANPMTVFAENAGNYYGVFNAGFVAESWADFGYPGVIVMSVILAAAAALGDLVVLGDGVKTREGAAVLVCMVYGAIWASQTAGQSALLSGCFGSIPILAALLKLVRVRTPHAPPDRASPPGLTESPVTP